VVRSLGPPPLPGHETAAEHYFGAVYERAVALAGALAAAGGLLDTGEADDAPLDAGPSTTAGPAGGPSNADTDGAAGAPGPDRSA
jgi:hypothetical protein